MTPQDITLLLLVVGALPSLMVNAVWLVLKGNVCREVVLSHALATIFIAAACLCLALS